MARSRQHLLGHLFKSVKARQEAAQPTTDLERADFIAQGRMPVQRAVAEDPSRRISVRCPRRAGKSWLALSIAIERCLRKPRSVWVILGLARPSVQQIFWSLIKQINTTLELNILFKEVELSATMPNGSVILFRGAETRSEIEKLRGGQYDGVIVDECKSFNPVIFTELIQDVIEPALNDRLGTLILIGTPGEILAGPFYEATCEPPIRYESEDGTVRYSNRPAGPDGDAYVPVECPYFWSFHTWTLRDNVEMPHLWTEALATKAKYGWSDQHPTWRREYLGHWVASKDHIVYRYVPHLHDFNGVLPDGHTWRYVLALDIGFKDADAIVVWAYAETSFDVYCVYAEKKTRQNLTELATWVREVRHSFPPELMTGDFGGLATKLFEELAVTHGLHFEPAEKREKNDFIEIMNTEYDLKRIHIRQDLKALKEELLQNRWLEKSLGTAKKVEDPKTANDLCDAHLYGWRWCDHRRATPPERKAVAPNTAEWWREKVASEFQEAIRQHLAAKNRAADDFGGMDQDWWHDR